MAYLSPADELFYGGSAGCGKSDLLLGIAITNHYKSLILRREATQLKELTGRIKELCSSDGWRGSGHGGTQELPNGGSIELAGCDHEKSKDKFQGRAHDLKCVGRGTLVLMGNGTSRPIEDIRVDDWVMTLEGPCRVNRVIPTTIKPAVRVDVWQDGRIVGNQIQSANHELYTGSNWSSYSSILADDRSCVLAQTPKHNRHRCKYDHPYTKEKRPVVLDLSPCSFSFTPVGAVELFDIEVSNANHYITSCGLVNKNCWDELPHFSESIYTFVNAWNRTTRPGQRCRIVAGGNPPTTSEGEWVIRRWAAWLDPAHHNPARGGELRWYGRLDGKEIECENGNPFMVGKKRVIPRSRTFIPGTVEDNPYLMEQGYDAVLEGLPEPLRSQMRYGNFRAGREDHEWTVIPTAWVEAAQRRWTPQGKTVPLTAMGVDVARGGRDSTSIARRYGNWFAPVVKFAGTSTPDGSTVYHRVLEHLDNLAAVVNIDILAVGSSPYDLLKAHTPKLNVFPINFGESTSLKSRTGIMSFRNLRAYAYWCLREALDPANGDNIQLPPSPEIIADLTAARWMPTPSGIQLESKDEIKKRIGRSPDCGDSLAMSMLVDTRKKAFIGII